MNNTWVKLYRKTIENGIMKDHLAWILFSWLLMTVDKDSGKARIGRYMVSNATAIKPNSYYRILKRLATKWKVITIQATKEYTSVQVVNWGKYQSSNSEQQHVSESTANQQLTSSESTANEIHTIQEYKNKRIQEYKSIDSITPALIESIAKDYGVPLAMVQLNYEKLKNYQGKNYKDFNKALRVWVLGDISKLKERSIYDDKKRGIDATQITTAVGSSSWKA